MANIKTLGESVSPIIDRVTSEARRVYEVNKPMETLANLVGVEEANLSQDEAIQDAINLPENRRAIHEIAAAQLKQDGYSSSTLNSLARDKARVPDSPSSYNARGQGGGFSLADVVENLSGKNYSDPAEARLDMKAAVQNFKRNNPGESAATYRDVESAAQEYVSSKLRHKSDGGQFSNVKTDELKGGFNVAIREEREKEEAKRLAQEAKDLAEGRLQNVSEGLGSVLNDVDENPDLLDDSIQSWTNDFYRSARRVGMKDGAIKKAIAKSTEMLTQTAVRSMIRRDPDEAISFLKVNADQIGKQVIGLKNEARNKKKDNEAAEQRAINKANRERKKITLKEIKMSLPFNMQDLVTLTKSGNKTIRAAAISKQNDLVKKPVQTAIDSGLIEEVIGDFNDTSELLQREEGQGAASKVLGSNIPFFAKNAELARFKDHVKEPDSARTFLDSSEQLEDGTKDAIADQLGGDAFGWALRIGNDQTELQNAIIRGKVAPLKPGQEKPGLSFEDGPAFKGVGGVTANKEALNAMNALVRGGMDEEDARKAVLNEHDIGSFFDSQKMTLPPGADSESFESTLNALFSDLDALKEVSNGEPDKARTQSGDPVTFDEDDLEVVPLRFGVYGLNVDGVPVTTEDGTLRFEINMEEALNGE